MHIITFPNKTTFVHKTNFINTLFKPINGKTATGTYEHKQGGLLFRKGNGEPFLMLVCNRWQETFFVSCHKTSQGKIRFMYGLCSADESFAGLDKLRYMEQQNLARTIHNETKEYYEKEWEETKRNK